MFREAHECILFSFLPILRCLFDAPPSSPYADVDVSNVAELLVSITQPSIVQAAEFKGIAPDKIWVNNGNSFYHFAISIADKWYLLSNLHIFSS